MPGPRDSRGGAERPNLARHPIQSLSQALVPDSCRKDTVQCLKRLSEVGCLLRLAMRPQKLEASGAVDHGEGREPRLPVPKPALHLLLRFRNFDKSGTQPVADIAHLVLVPLFLAVQAAKPARQVP